MQWFSYRKSIMHSQKLYIKNMPNNETQPQSLETDTPTTKTPCILVE